MYKKYYYIFLVSLILGGCSHSYHVSRSPFRTYKQELPKITVHIDSGADVSYSCISSCYAHSPIFTLFDDHYFSYHTLPDLIPPQTEHAISIPSEVIKKEITNLINELYAHKKTFKDFTIIQRKNFNRYKVCGLLVLKFNKYPFILKLFIESPKTFINLYCKGLEPITFFFMAQGSNRHLAGLTRIKNLEYIKNKLESLPRWHNCVHLPRKWFWQPLNGSYITITGLHIHKNHPIIKTRIPSVYAIIADYIDIPNSHIAGTTAEEKIIMDLCHDLEMIIDPHITNFLFHTEENNDMHHITILDTEHFPSMVGTINAYAYTNYSQWYLYLVTKYIHDTLGKRKNECY